VVFVNDQAEGLGHLRERIVELEAALRPFVHSRNGYTSGIGKDGARWCAPRVTQAEMTAARVALEGATPVPRIVGGFVP
jgi:hypothetical protein